MAEGTWWQRGVIYQVYPRSFQDTDGDGTGDLRGITERLPYLVGLGVDAVWISPIYPSPMRDGGYDVSDYRGVDPLFGTLGDMDALLARAHELGLKVILDFVPNHTSDQHPWFAESRSSRLNPKRDWYIWRDAKPDGSAPNNWMSNFGGSAWQWDEPTGQFYYHAFLTEQPDLNWRNPAVREAMFEAMRFWLRRGVDGFRVDVLWHLIKDAAFRDNPPNPAWHPGRPDIERFLQVHSTDQPEVHEVVAAMRRVVDEFPDRVLIGEIYLPVERLVTYYGRHGDEANLPFNFGLVLARWDAPTVGALVESYEAALPPGAWPNWVLGNHDQPRVAARIGEAQARVALTLLLTLRGTPTLYYGDELGLGHVPVPPDRVQDPWEKNEPGHGFGRDPERTPMQWDASEGAGFSTGEPWLPLSPDHRVRNVVTQSADPGSFLSLCRRLLALRRATPALELGDYHPVSVPAPALAFERRLGPARILVVLNLSGGPQEVSIDDDLTGAEFLFGTVPDRTPTLSGHSIALHSDEAIVMSLTPR